MGGASAYSVDVTDSMCWVAIATTSQNNNEPDDTAEAMDATNPVMFLSQGRMHTAKDSGTGGKQWRQQNSKPNNRPNDMSDRNVMPGGIITAGKTCKTSTQLHGQTQRSSPPSQGRAFTPQNTWAGMCGKEAATK